MSVGIRLHVRWVPRELGPSEAPNRNPVAIIKSQCSTSRLRYAKHSMRAGGYIHRGETSRGAAATRPNTVCDLLDTKRETGREAAGTSALSWTGQDGPCPSAPRNGPQFCSSFACRKSPRGPVHSFIKWADSHDLALVEDDAIDCALRSFVTNCFCEGKMSCAADRLIVGLKFLDPRFFSHSHA